MGNALKPRDFEWSYTDEPHATRRREILKAHPDIQALFGPEPKTKYIVTALVLTQVLMAYLLRNAPWYWMLGVGYVVGATINHALFLAIHELAHNLAFKRTAHNRLFAMFANIPIGIPYSVTFRTYHLDHHKFQGVDVIDTDIPTEFEVRFFNSTIMKFVWVCSQILFYALRPLFYRAIDPDLWLALNWAVQFTFDAVLIYTCGLQAYGYFVLSTFLAGSAHPCAGHFIAEHYTFVKGVETYSYYGPLNYLTFNVGYHNEHHDFPYIAWSNLPKLKQIASEYYDPLPKHDSWVKVMYNYVTDPEIGPFCRVKRSRSRDNKSE